MIYELEDKVKKLEKIYEDSNLQKLNDKLEDMGLYHTIDFTTPNEEYFHYNVDLGYKISLEGQADLDKEKNSRFYAWKIVIGKIGKLIISDEDYFRYNNDLENILDFLDNIDENFKLIKNLIKNLGYVWEEK
jgi:hypothetical protein